MHLVFLVVIVTRLINNHHYKKKISYNLASRMANVLKSDVVDLFEEQVDFFSFKCSLREYLIKILSVVSVEMNHMVLSRGDEVGG